ncbi:hypothetical protein [Burkholderia ubonensis]|uniref:hypothetical protein n=1 Tax=Burkholderia ubonensis TaxID=101571 RepID=UPI0007550E46|nr:hypothetical protein [Burkholderia ubonensis]KVP16856.1 hypothetical protein WJ84_00860 [Burkholderia ubonensis]
MIECNGAYVITHDHKHGNAVYRCTLANAKKLLENCLKTQAPELAKLAETLKGETRAVLPVTWLTRALAEVRDMKESPTSLRRVLHGPGPRERGADDPRPMPVITKEMQEELVLSFFRSQLKLEGLDSRSPMTVSQLTSGWDTLQFLEPARQRLSQGVLFIEDYLYDGYEELRVLLNDRWKDTAREENIVGNHFCPFLSTWGSGRWAVEPVIDA